MDTIDIGAIGTQTNEQGDASYEEEEEEEDKSEEVK